MKKVAFFFSLIAAVFGTLLALRGINVHFNAAQIASVLIFSTFIFGTLLFGEFRLAFAFGGIAVLFATGLLSVDQFTESANLRVIIFLVGMFLVIGYLEENQFFEHIVNHLVRLIGPRPELLVLALMIMASVSAALVDEVTSILFMTGTMLHLTRKYRLYPTPFILMLVFATNIGSAMSSIGNPIGVLISFNAGFSFLEFLRWSAPIALVVNIVTYLICRWWFRESFSLLRAAMHTHVGEREETEIESGLGHVESIQQWVCWMIFGGTLILLVTHGLTEHWLGTIFAVPGGKLHEGTMMVGASLFMGCIVLLIRGNKARELVERRVDWWTLSFFMMLFASVGTLEHTRVTEVIAKSLIHATGGNQGLLIQVIGWATGWLSAFLDNVLAVATFMPVVHDVRAAAAPEGYPSSIYWLMLFGGTFMGNMTVIGSTANIIALGVLEKRGHRTISFIEWFKIGLIVSLASMVVASVLLEVQSKWIPMLPPPAAGHR